VTMAPSVEEVAAVRDGLGGSTHSTCSVTWLVGSHLEYAPKPPERTSWQLVAQRSASGRHPVLMAPSSADPAR
jgi:hypothetical protein